ncbi:hypothetical protein CmmCFBP4999_15780 [Clavibacter michiganensis subsp. michiganensis]|nr:hypothetical protein [Clavibacter michiganensis subsp. michiganensis]MWJ49245.1 hypothetical protein [Clavibacter michiganensis subsp. michiganensis]MWJ90134.1 hypothetical protein [Clavibacter michiganensis subsp. michiganensis]OQJ65324.1 hypothetical protein B5P23_04725 [Clavibacter michiganensis subsp. michiganensis]RMC84537.1 hypothetical protein CmmCFBP4999_15780 [Clavibacter michiganensis subsp. michiganensis]
MSEMIVSAFREAAMVSTEEGLVAASADAGAMTTALMTANIVAIAITREQSRRWQQRGPDVGVIDAMDTMNLVRSMMRGVRRDSGGRTARFMPTDGWKVA